jgi:hypothetical protein
MKPIRFRLLIPGVLTLLAMAAGAAAQDSPALLSSLEVKQHNSNAQPADHARLRDHFSALADRYTAEADRHTTMAMALIGNPNHGSSTSPADHCRRLAEVATNSAATVRELSAHHERLAAGMPWSCPGTLRFEAWRINHRSGLRVLAAGARPGRSPRPRG